MKNGNLKKKKITVVWRHLGRGGQINDDGAETLKERGRPNADIAMLQYLVLAFFNLQKKFHNFWTIALCGTRFLYFVTGKASL